MLNLLANGLSSELPPDLGKLASLQVLTLILTDYDGDGVDQRFYITVNERPGATVSSAAAADTEGGSVTYTVLLDTAPVSDVVIKVAVSGGRAADAWVWALMGVLLILAAIGAAILRCRQRPRPTASTPAPNRMRFCRGFVIGLNRRLTWSRSGGVPRARDIPSP